MAHIREPEKHKAIFGIEDRRLKIYRELFFNNIKGFLSSGFPVLESLYTEDGWEKLARLFFSHHDCRSPYFVDISKEFVEFLSNEYISEDEDFLFLQELAHYEWLELDISVRKANIQDDVWRNEEPFNAVYFSPLAELVSYGYPVHQISEDFIPTEPLKEPVYLVVNRRSDDEVSFTQVNMVTASLLNLILQYEQITLKELVSLMQSQMPEFPEEQLRKALGDILEQMLTKQILLPTS